MKNGLGADGLSSSGFAANSLKLCLHALAYAIFVLYREDAYDVPQVARARVATVRSMLFKVAAVVKTNAHRF